MIRSSIAIRIQRGKYETTDVWIQWLWRAGDWGACNGDVPLSSSDAIGCHQILLDAIKYGNSCFYYTHSLQSPTPYCSSLVSFALPSFKVKASACNFHLCSIPSLQQTPQSTQPDSHSAPTNPRVSFSCYFGVSGRIRPKQSVSVQQQPSQNTQLQASLSITHHPLSHLWR